MKKTLLISALALGCISASAQKIELGLNGGALPFTTTTQYDNPDNEKAGYYASARMSMRIGNWQAGSGLDKFTRSSTSTVDGSYSTLVTRRKYNTIAPYVFLNRVVQLPGGYLYAGINAGLNATKFSQEGEETPKTKDVFFCGTGMNYDAKYRGYNGGVQAGYTVRVYKGFSANVEAGARYIRMSSDGGYKESQVTFPMSVGIRYDMKMCSKMCCKKKAATTEAQP